METNQTADLSRRNFVSGVAGAVAASAIGAAGAATTTDATEDKAKLGGVHAIPELAPQWKQIDLAKVLKYPAAFLSISQNNSLYKPWGAQAAERHWERRFRKLDYTALGSEPLYRESMTETYRYDDLAEPMAGRPLRPAAMLPDDVLIRVTVTRTRFGIDRVFGPEVLFVLRRDGRVFEIQTVHEDFTAP